MVLYSCAHKIEITISVDGSPTWRVQTLIGQHLPPISPGRLAVSMIDRCDREGYFTTF